MSLLGLLCSIAGAAVLAKEHVDNNEEYKAKKTVSSLPYALCASVAITGRILP
jgi:hypothetical protein